MMTDQPVKPSAESAPDLGQASIGRVLHDQRKTLLVAGVLIVFGMWFGQYGDWTLAACIAGGIVIGLINHLATEYWLLKIITRGIEPTRGQLIRATIVRLAVLTVCAIAIAVAFWPSGIGLLLGLAIFRLIALAMTALPLLKELKQQ